jgi:Lon-like ATP-dependent protease
MILMEQLRSIKRELGLEKDDKSSLIDNFRKKWEPKQDAAPEEVRRYAAPTSWAPGGGGGAAV